ncbi:hypothetical protein JCM14469_42280 [Desulfatiferula olefinivorans]
METLYDFFAKPIDPKLYSGVQISLASPEQIRQWSHGEIKKPETINYRTFKPEREGLFCAKIFGPTKDYECNCGKYKRMKHRGVVCEKCGVEVIQSKVRRERLGHIELATPVSHIWFLKSLPSKIGNLLDITLKNMERVLYFDSYIVLDPKDTGLTRCQMLTEDQYQDAMDLYGANNFTVGIGAEAVKTLLKELDIKTIYTELRDEVRSVTSVAKRQKLSKRMRIIDAFMNSGIDPSWMIMDVIPVLPPDLRPLVPLEGGRFATSDLNDLYRRVINRNNRLKRLVELKAPDIIVRNEKRMLQESVDVLFDNGRHGRVVTGTNKRPLKSLSDTLKGKQGRFRQNLLGKRVDYSGRTVIVVGPDLRLHQCGLPKKMALELFKPYIYHRLEKSGFVSTVKSAKKMVEKEVPEVWDTLDEVVKEYPVMLNRAPTLHRLGIQAFEPVLVEGKALQLHPLVCTAFNADFDGDQMAVHVPLSIESQIEARVLMLASNNTLSPANGQPIIVPTQDIVLGLYYMTRQVAGAKGEGSVFASLEEVRIAYDDGVVSLHSAIKVRLNGSLVETTVGRVILWEIIPSDPVYSFRHILLRDADTAATVYGKLNDGADFAAMIVEHSTSLDKDRGGLLGFLNKEEFDGAFKIAEPDLDALFSLDKDDYSEVIEMDGRYYIFQVTRIRPGVPFAMVNKVLDKGACRALIDYAYRNIGPKATVILSDKLKNMGYRYSTEGGLSICIDDMIIPETKWDIIKDSEDKVTEIARQYSEGLITQGEKYNKVVDIWAKATDDIANEMMKSMNRPSMRMKRNEPSEDLRLAEKTEDTINSIFMMADSGARGSKDQMRQLAGMRGLMAKPSGEIIETPIQANFREGLSVLQYFISTHGARKGLADTALKTANSGYLTRRLADVAQDCAVVEYDCGTLMGIEVEALMEGGEVIQRLGERILGRVTLEDVYDPFTDEILVPHGVEIDENILEIIENAGITSIKIRSVLTCKATTGVCAKCYGRDLSHGQTVEMGQAVGILAAQSIGEPGTQLTMRTFHIGGTASRKVEVAEIKARVDGKIKYLEGLNVVQTASGDRIIMSRRGGEFAIVGEAGREREKNSVIYGARIHVADGQMVKAGDVLATWDPFTVPIITEVDGRVKFGDIEAGKTMQEKLDPVTGKSSRTIIESRLGDVRPRISIKDANNKTAVLGSGLARYPLPVDAVLLVEEFDEVKAGDILAKLPRATTKTKDITGGLPRVAELFEVRKPKETAVLSEIDGFVSISKGTKGKQKVTVSPVDVGEKKEYQIPKGRHVNVYEGDYVRAGEKLTSGSENPQDILSIKGEVALASYLVDEVQQVYRLQGVRINDKHIEVIVRQMMKRVKIIDAGDTDFIAEEQVDRQRFADVNREVVEKGGEPATGEPLVLGITKASLSTDSFISAASFQETTKVLTEAGIRGKVDTLSGLKENVIMGRLIPAGSGVRMYRDIEIESEIEVSREENVTIDL